MSIFPPQALQDGVKPKEVWAWAMYDFANSGFTTVVLTAVFNAYFVGVVTQEADWGTLAWTLTLAASSLIVMLSMPLIGARADARGHKKRYLFISTLACVAATLVLALCGPGDVALAVVAVIIANVFFSYGESLTAAFLPEIARPEALGRVSGWGWSFGYFGGMLTLGMSLAYVLWAQGQGQTAQQFVPVTMVITAAVFLLASTFTFWGLRERARVSAVDGGSVVEGAFERLLQTARQAQHHRDFIWLLACGCAYQAGIAVVIALAAVYAEQAMGFRQIDTMVLIFLVNIASAIGAFTFGYWQDRIGHKPALGWTLVGWIVMTLLAVAAQGPALFWVAAVIAGLCMGSSQSAGRAMAGLLAPPDRSAEFFGLWTFSTRLAAIIGPVTYGLVTWVTQGNHRLAILATGAFFLLGLVLLWPIRVQQSVRK